MLPFSIPPVIKNFIKTRMRSRHLFLDGIPHSVCGRRRKSRRRTEKRPQHLAFESDLIWCMVLRDSKRKRLKRTNQATIDRELKLLSKLQAESLKVHGHPLDPPKNVPATKKRK